MPPRKVDPPQDFTWRDRYQILLGVLAIPLGVLILWRTAAIAVAPPAILLGLAFIGFGVYRLHLAWSRYRLYRKAR